MTEIVLKQVREPYKRLVNATIFQSLIENRPKMGEPAKVAFEKTIHEVEEKANTFYQQIASFTGVEQDDETLTQNLTLILKTVLQLPKLIEQYQLPRSRNYKAAVGLILSGEGDYRSLENRSLDGWTVLLGWGFNQNLGKTIEEEDYETLSGKLMEDWLLGKILAETMNQLGLDQGLIYENTNLIKVLVKNQNWHHERTPKRDRVSRILKSWIEDPDTQQYIKINRFSGITWFNKEAMESFLRWILTIGAIQIFIQSDFSGSKESKQGTAEEIADLYSIIKKIKKASDASEYQVDKLLKGVE